MLDATIKILEENTGSKFLDISHSNIFSDISPQAREKKEKNKQMGLHQSEKFLNNKGNHQQNEKTTHWMGEDIHHDTCDKELISKMYKELMRLNTKQTNK